MNNIFRKICLGIMCLLSFVSYANANDISFKASVKQNPILMGEATQLRLEVRGTQDVPRMQLPEVDGLDIKYVGPSRQVSMVNGRVDSSVTHTYTVFPLRTGDFTIPALLLNFKGQDYRSDPIALKVLDADSSAAGKNLELADRIYLNMKVAEDDVYVNQGIPVSLVFYVTGLNVRQVSAPDLNSQGFLVKDYEQKPQQGQTVKDGLRFNVVEFKTIVYPTREGNLALNPARMDVNIEIPAEERRNKQSGLFSDAFFDHFFSNQVKTLSLKSNGLTLNVKPLPEKGKPDNFSNAVGEFDFKATVSPNDVNVGDPITVKVAVTGEGNLKAIEMPRYSESNDFRTYDAVVKEENGVKILEQVLIPKNQKVKEVPAIILSYFDPITKEYREKKSGPFPITVRKGLGGSGINVVGLSSSDNLNEEEEVFGEDIVFIKEDIGGMSKRGRFIHTSPVFYFFVLFVLIGYGVSFKYMSTNERLRIDKNYARKHKARKRIKKEVAKLSQLMDQGDSIEFYTALPQTLKSYLADVLGLPLGIVTSDAILSRQEFGVLPEITRTSIKEILDQCEQIQYASVSVDRFSMDKNFEQFKVPHFP